MPDDLIPRDAAKEAIHKALDWELWFEIESVVVAALDAIPAAEGGERVAKPERTYNKYGEPVCPHCNQATNRAYAKHRILQCWSCGKYMPELPE